MGGGNRDYNDQILDINAYYDIDASAFYLDLHRTIETGEYDIFYSTDGANYQPTDASFENNFALELSSPSPEVYIMATQTFSNGFKLNSNIVKMISDDEFIYIQDRTDSENDLGYIPDDNLGKSISLLRLGNFGNMINQYPDGSCFSNTGVSCTCHGYVNGVNLKNTCNYLTPCDCICFNSSIQCMAFAKKAYYENHDRNFTSSELTTLNTQWNVTTAKNLLNNIPLGNPTGIYLRVRTSGGFEHSISIISSSPSHIQVYHANYGGNCLVRFQRYTWEDFISAFPYIYSYVK